MSGAESSLANKFLEICQELTRQGKTFSFSLKTNPFSFSLDTKENENVLETRTVKKKLSPSSLRRNLKRKEIFLKKKAESKESDEQHYEEVPKSVDVSYQCDQCENKFGTENGLKIHIGKTHKNSSLPPIEKLLQSLEKDKPKQVSPSKDIREEEKDELSGEEDFRCKGCEREFSSEDDLTEHEMSECYKCHICHQFFESFTSRKKHLVENCLKS